MRREEITLAEVFGQMAFIDECKKSNSVIINLRD